MPGDSTELAARLALCTPTDTLRGLFFRGLLDAVRAEQGDADAAQVAACLAPQRHRDFRMYPLTEWFPALECAVGLLAPRLGVPGAMRRLGTQATEDFLASPLGRVLLLVAGGNPTRLVQSAPTSYRIAVSWGERRVEFLTPRRCHLHFERELVPLIFYEGAVLSGAVALQAEVRVRSIQETLTQGRLEIDWLESSGGTAEG